MFYSAPLLTNIYWYIISRNNIGYENLKTCHDNIFIAMIRTAVNAPETHNPIE